MKGYAVDPYQIVDAIYCKLGHIQHQTIKKKKSLFPLDINSNKYIFYIAHTMHKHSEQSKNALIFLYIREV